MTGRYQVIKVLLKPVGEVTYEDDVPESQCSLCMWSMSRLTSMFTPCKTCTTRGPEVPGATMQLVHRHGLDLGSGRCPHRAKPTPHVALKCRGHDATCAWTWSMSRLRSTSTPCKTCTTRGPKVPGATMQLVLAHVNADPFDRLPDSSVKCESATPVICR